jgi:hypothetical protein
MDAQRPASPPAVVAVRDGATPVRPRVRAPPRLPCGPTCPPACSTHGRLAGLPVTQPLSLLGYAMRQRSNSATMGERPLFAREPAPALAATGARSDSLDDMRRPAADDAPGGGGAFLAPPIVRYNSHSGESSASSRYSGQTHTGMAHTAAV